MELHGGSVFAVVGDYMKDSTALGLLDGMVAEGIRILFISGSKCTESFNGEFSCFCR